MSFHTEFDFVLSQNLESLISLKSSNLTVLIVPPRKMSFELPF